MEENVLFVINDVFFITNAGTVVTAEIFNEVHVGDKIIIASDNLTAIGLIVGVEKFVNGQPQKFDSASNGESVGVYIDYPTDFTVRKGMFVLKADS